MSWRSIGHDNYGDADDGGGDVDADGGGGDVDADDDGGDVDDTG